MTGRWGLAPAVVTTTESRPELTPAVGSSVSRAGVGVGVEEIGLKKKQTGTNIPNGRWTIFVKIWNPNAGKSRCEGAVNFVLANSFFLAVALDGQPPWLVSGFLRNQCRLENPTKHTLMLVVEKK